jgi:hypothetical protein
LGPSLWTEWDLFKITKKEYFNDLGTAEESLRMAKMTIESGMLALRLHKTARARSYFTNKISQSAAEARLYLLTTWQNAVPKRCIAGNIQQARNKTRCVAKSLKTARQCYICLVSYK